MSIKNPLPKEPKAMMQTFVKIMEEINLKEDEAFEVVQKLKLLAISLEKKYLANIGYNAYKRRFKKQKERMDLIVDQEEKKLKAQLEKNILTIHQKAKEEKDKKPLNFKQYKKIFDKDLVSLEKRVHEFGAENA